jgi:hypothetical protein
LPSKKASTRSKAEQARNKRRLAANALVRKKAEVLRRAHLIEPGTSAKAQSTKAGVKAMSGEKKAARNRINRLFAEHGKILSQPGYRPQPAELQQKASLIPKSRVAGLRAAGETVIKVGDKYRVLHTPQERVTKAGYVEPVVPGHNITGRLKLTANALKEYKDGSTRLERYIRNAFANKQDGQELAFQFSVNDKARVWSIRPFKSADAMIDYLQNYTLKIDDDDTDLGYLIILDAYKLVEIAQKQGKEEREGTRKRKNGKRNTTYKPVSELQKSQHQQRNIDRRKAYVKQRAKQGKTVSPYTGRKK